LQTTLFHTYSLIKGIMLQGKLCTQSVFASHGMARQAVRYFNPLFCSSYRGSTPFTFWIQNVQGLAKLRFSPRLGNEKEYFLASSLYVGNNI